MDYFPLIIQGTCNLRRLCTMLLKNVIASSWHAEYCCIKPQQDQQSTSQTKVVNIYPALNNTVFDIKGAPTGSQVVAIIVDDSNDV